MTILYFHIFHRRGLLCLRGTVLGRFDFYLNIINNHINFESLDNLKFLDDIDFNKTNPGIWTMGMKDFKSKAGYTKWDDYKQDEPIKEDIIWPVHQTSNN